MARIKKVTRLAGTNFGEKIRVVLDRSLSLNALLDIQTKLIRASREVIPDVFAHGTISQSRESLDFVFKKGLIKNHRHSVKDIISRFERSAI